MFIGLANSGEKSLLHILVTISATLLGFILGGLLVQLASQALPSNLITPNLNFLIQLIPFCTGLMTLLYCMKAVHRRHPLSLISASHSIDWQRFGTSVLIWFLILCLIETILWSAQIQEYELQFEWRRFAVLACISICLIPIQAGFEELLFRGFLLQMIGSMFNSATIGIIVSAILFTLLHLANPEIELFGLVPMMMYYVFFGLLFGLLTILDGRSEIAVGMHTGNNLFGALVVSFQGSAIQTSSIFYVKNINFVWTVVMTITGALLFFVIVYRMYYLKKQRSYE